MSEQDDVIQDEVDNVSQTKQLQDYYALSLEDRQSLQHVHSRFLLQQRSRSQAQLQTESRSVGQFIQFPRPKKKKASSIWSFALLVAVLLIVSLSGILVVSNHHSFELAAKGLSTVSASQISIVNVDMTSMTTGWGAAVSKPDLSQFLIRTIDGGKHWQEFPSVHPLAGITDDIFLNDTTAWILSSAGTKAEQTTSLLSTHDGGQHWQTSSIPLADSAITFVDAQHGWAWPVTQTKQTNFLLHTIDGGKTWTKFIPTLTLKSKNGISIHSVLPWLAQTGITFSLTFVTPEVGWFIVDATHSQAFTVSKELFRTVDGGMSWTEQTTGGSNQTLFTAASLTIPKFSDAQHGLIGTFMPNSATTANGQITIFSTPDGGQSWQMAGQPIDYLDIGLTAAESIFLIDATHVAIVGKDVMYIYALTHQSWVELWSSHWSGIPNVKFINSQTGWLQVVQSSTQKGKFTSAMYRTQDGGRTWQEAITLTI